MIDFHSHVLPGIDDGAGSSKMSMEMLSLAHKSGVTTVVATPHCYIHDEDSISRFLSRRENSHQRLMQAIAETNAQVPQIILGSEVRVEKYMSKLPDLDKLCIEGTDYILLEMPYSLWEDWMFEEVYRVTLRGLRPIMAHLDRFFTYEKHFSNLYSMNVLFQINASAFTDNSLRRKMVALFENDSAHVVGSDMHNTTTRPPNLAEAYQIIEKKFGWEYVDFLKNNSSRIVANKDAIPTRLPKIKGLKKIFI